MKKIILSFLFFVLVALTGYSQMSLSLSDSTGPIPNNSTVTYMGSSTTDEIVAYAFVTNNGTDPVPVKVKKVELYTLPGVTNVFCWGLCFAPTVYVSTTTITIDPRYRFTGFYRSRDAGRRFRVYADAVCLLR